MGLFSKILGGSKSSSSSKSESSSESRQESRDESFARSGARNRSFIDPLQSPLLGRFYGDLPGIYDQGVDTSFAPRLQSDLDQLSPAVMSGLLSTIRGDYLPGGEAFNDQMEAIGRTIQPQIASQFGRAGRFGSGLHKIGFGKALVDAGTDLYQDLYQQERDRQFNAFSGAPGIFDNFRNIYNDINYNQPYASIDAFRRRIGDPTILREGSSDSLSSSLGTSLGTSRSSSKSTSSGAGSSGGGLGGLIGFNFKKGF